jgi:hypothetical protein
MTAALAVFGVLVTIALLVAIGFWISLPKRGRHAKRSWDWWLD